MTSARVLHPEIRVTLFKLVARERVNGSISAAQRYTGTARRIDLSPLFSDMGACATHKSVRSASGGFTLTFSDAPTGKGPSLESIYGLIEPMDGIEIRLSHNHGQRTAAPPVVMRGFVSKVARSQRVDSRGAPIRTVTVTGHDYGKIWDMLRVLWQPYYLLGETWLSSFPLFERFGIAVRSNMSGDELVREIVDKVLNPHLADMLPQDQDWPMPRSITVEAMTGSGTTSLTGPQNAEGSIYSILATFLDVGPGFNELFIEDREESVVAVFRPNPALDLDGSPIQPTTQGGTPARRQIDGADLVSLDFSRSDQDVANYFWCEAARYELTDDRLARYQAVTTAERNTVIMTDYPNNRPSIYGIRPMIVASNMGASDTFNSGQNAAGQQARDGQVVSWLQDRRRILAAMNRDNALLERGEAVIAGNEAVRAGIHVDIGEGALKAPYYVAAVSHQYLPFKGFFTILDLDRGQGFAKRIQSGGQVSPYLLELGAGPDRQSAPRRGDISQTDAPGPAEPPVASTATER